MYLHRKRRDANHGPLAKLAEQIGASHMDTSQLGDDYPDAVIGFQGVNYLIEFKRRGGKLKRGQQRFRDTWRGQVDKIETADELLALLLGDAYATKKTMAVDTVLAAQNVGRRIRHYRTKTRSGDDPQRDLLESDESPVPDWVDLPLVPAGPLDSARQDRNTDPGGTGAGTEPDGHVPLVVPDRRPDD